MFAAQLCLTIQGNKVGRSLWILVQLLCPQLFLLQAQVVGLPLETQLECFCWAASSGVRDQSVKGLLLWRGLNFLFSGNELSLPFLSLWACQMMGFSKLSTSPGSSRSSSDFWQVYKCDSPLSVVKGLTVLCALLLGRICIVQAPGGDSGVECLPCGSALPREWGGHSCVCM